MRQRTKLEANKGGRPTHKPTAALRFKVAAAAGGGMHRDEIAVAMGLSTPTLEKYYWRELNELAFKMRQDVVAALTRSALKGNVSAQKAYLARNPDIAVAPAASDVKPEPALGKKEQANIDAVGAEKGTSWESILPRTGTVQ